MVKLSKFSEIDCSDIINNSGSTKNIEIKEKMSVKFTSSKVVSEEVQFYGVLSSGFEYINVKGLLQYTIEMECSRCLESTYKDYASGLEAIFTKDNEDETLSIPQSLIIDLEGLVADCITDSMNMQYICKVNCLGLCSICGENKNLNDCGHTLDENKKNSKDNPFSLLNELDLKVE